MMIDVLHFAVLSTLIALISAVCVIAQDELPVIRADSKSVSVQEGDLLMKDVWNLSPEVSPDTYFTVMPRKKSKVTFITDLDSISFETEFGKTYDFIILLNGKDKCLTRISANYNGVYSPQVINRDETAAPSELPFTMRGSRIYLTGKVNGRDNAAIQFDLGAGITCVNAKSVEKLRVQFDDTINISNSQGTYEESLSSHNTLEIGNLRWTDIPLAQVHNMKTDEDLIIGNTLFEEKVIEIDYDRKVILVHDSLDIPTFGFSEHAIILDQHCPKIEATISVNGESYTDWFLFDTGRDGTMVLGEEITRKHELWNKYQTVFKLWGKKIVVLPEIVVGDLAFADVVTNAADPSKNSGMTSKLGNEILNHFNVVLDNPNGMIYLKPNTLENKTYSTYAELKRTLLLWASGALVLIAGCVLIAQKWRRVKQETLHDVIQTPTSP